MIPATFEYRRAMTQEKAVALLTEAGGEARFLAGGHSLVPLMKLRFSQPERLVDIMHVPGLAGVWERNGLVGIGSTTTHTQLERSAILREVLPVVSEAAGEIGDPQVRNRGTIGGSLAHADPAADLPAAALALDVQLVARGPGGERVMEASAFFVDLLETALEPHEVLTEVRVPIPGAGSGSAYAKFPNPASHYAVVGVAARVDMEGGAVREARVAVTGAADVAYRSTAAEERLQGSNGDATAIAEAAGLAADGREMLDDLSASAVYRAHLVTVHAQRALERAVAAAG